jgi:hypothetical protein
MSHEYLLWIALFSYAIHMFEEYELNWRDWARSVLGLPVDWNSFYIANGIVVVMGVCCAEVGWRAPWFGLGLPALMLINATLFHVAPTIAKRVYSPGLATALVLFYPSAGWAYYGAWADGVLTLGNGVGSVLLGAGVMATPIVLLKIKGWRTFAYGAGVNGDAKQ